MNPQQIRAFILAGNALFTLKSLRTGKHFTFKVRGVEPQAGTPPTHWNVSVLNGPDNSRNYKWIGRITTEGSEVFLHKAGVPSAQGFNWLWQMLKRGNAERFNEQCEFRHAGRCGRCGRLLTHPDSIQSGIGPECADKMAFEAMGGVDGLMNQLFGG